MAITGLMAKADKSTPSSNAVKAARLHALWDGILEGLSGPFLMGLELKVPIPSRDDKGRKVLIKDIEDIKDDVVQMTLSRAMHETMIKIAAQRGIEFSEQKFRELDAAGKVRTFTRLRPQRQFN